MGLRLIKDGNGGYRTCDGRFTIRPAYAPSILGGSVSRPSSWAVTVVATGRGWAEPTLARVREALTGR